MDWRPWLPVPGTRQCASAMIATDSRGTSLEHAPISQ